MGRRINIYLSDRSPEMVELLGWCDSYIKRKRCRSFSLLVWRALRLYRSHRITEDAEGPLDLDHKPLD